MASGRMLEPMGDVTPAQLYDAFREEAVGYAEGGADVIWIMTMFDIQEAVLAVKAAKDFTKLPVMASMSFDFTPKGGRTMMGVDPKTSVEKLIEAGADVIGHNCGGATPEESTHILREMGTLTDMPLVAKPNAGIPESVDGRQVYPATPDRYAKEVPAWIAAGARVVGGCCGAGLEHTAKIAEAVKAAGL
jgi:5-methyltetrahydrofolate--homocysteine methyltransferase